MAAATVPEAGSVAKSTAGVSLGRVHDEEHSGELTYTTNAFASLDADREDGEARNAGTSTQARAQALRV